MRLIDADRVLLNKDERILGYTDINAALKLQMMKIVNAPTIEAIPIDWLKKRFMDRDSPKWCYDWHVIADCLIEYWEKENEIN